jgi:stage III sporulation protein AB
LGKNLGYLDKEMQLKAITFVLEYIDGAVNKINESIGKQTRMYKTLGVLCGLLIIVIMF